MLGYEPGEGSSSLSGSTNDDRRVGWLGGGLQSHTAEFDSPGGLHGGVVITAAHLACNQKVKVRLPWYPPISSGDEMPNNLRVIDVNEFLQIAGLPVSVDGRLRVAGPVHRFGVDPNPIADSFAEKLAGDIERAIQDVVWRAKASLP